MVDVRAYTRRDGTSVRAHTRSYRGSGRELSLLALAAIVVLAISGGGSGNAPYGSEEPHHKPAVERTDGGKQPVVRVVFPTGRPAQPGVGR
jgi:hypothetical protein